ncbi:MAG TPA: hypothetical protein VKM35_01565 [Arenimonas sp.]|uniref:hypothetical protein n=1 Tax=Arenimonas sp. TaxID=1872635 RepID=UPI002B9EDAC0|nr:hypothetical protein [Arenimonas sp.]HMB55875.1 hypothetical protein [Arenimonas sp.]
MDISELAVRLTIMLLPGVVAASVVERLTVHKPWDPFRFGLNSVLLGAASYLVAQIVMLLAMLFGGQYQLLTFWSSLDQSQSVINFPEILGVVCVGLCLGLICTIAINTRGIHRLAAKFGITEKYGDDSLFYYYLNSSDVAWVRILLPDQNKLVEGVRESHSEQDGCREVLLRDVRVYRADDHKFWYEVEAMYICSKEDLLIIEQPRGKKNG